MAPSIQFRIPPSWFFKFPPDDQPLALPPPTDARTFASPFGIPTDIYNGALDYKVPITIGSLYAVTVILWNNINRSRGNKPYGFSQTGAFKAFVILHNVFLAVFSALTFFGMLRALAHTWPGREHHLLGKFWPGLRASNGIAGAADALCKMHGPRGFGQFVAFDRDSHLWQARDKLVRLSEGTGLPDGTDVGRLWNEGLAFWGWWFYLSKFYEVFDTFIILSKGKRSSTLQTYHHTGAMMCMWAGIRYMSPPIWMFCFLNSGIHTMMYIYYTLSALSIRVPQRVKRSLTTMQILQFLIGITFAGMHLFVTYRVPITRTEQVSRTLEAIASSVVDGVSEVAASATNAGIAAWLKQAALRAAGEEGLAENVLAQPVQSPIFGDRSKSHQQTRYVSGWETVSCIDTSGQSFAIWLNLMYLAPLTGLFVRFFVKSYTRRGRASRQNPSNKQRLIKAAEDAAHGTNREIDSLGKTAEDSVEEISKHMNGSSNGTIANGKNHGNNNNGTPRPRKVSDTISKTVKRFEKGGSEELGDTAKSAKSTLKKKASDGHEKLRSMFEEGNRSQSPSQSRSQDRGRTSSSDVETTAKEYGAEAVRTAEEAVRKVRDAIGASPPSEDSTESIPEVESEPASPVHAEKKEKDEKEPTPKKDDLQESWADVAKDTYQHKEQEAQQPQAKEDEQEAQQPQAKEDEQEAQQPQAREDEQATAGAASTGEEERAATPTQRSLSPQKSKLPRPTSQGPRARSPEKKAPAPTPVPAAPTSESGESKKKNKPKELPRPAAPGANGTTQPDSSTSPSKSDQGREEENKDESAASHSISEASKKEKENKSDTNNDTEQDSTAGADSNTSVEEESGEDKERLRFKHTDSEELSGGEAERKDGVSFADAVKKDVDASGTSID